MSAGMDLTPLVSPESQVVQGYFQGGFRISGQRHEGPVIVLPDRVLAWDGNADVAAFSGLSGIEILILGTGDAFELLEPRLKFELRQQGMACEAMTTPAACRTYSVLLTEGRKVAAALIPVGTT